MFLVNGESKHCIDVIDRGLQYGDGLFETFAITDWQPVFFQRHLARLKTGCEKLFIPFPDAQLLSDEARYLCQNSAQAVLKLIITRGIGGRGYRQPDVIHPTRIFSLHPFPDYCDTLQQEGISVRFCQHRLSHNPVLAGLKHLNRLEQVLARAEWHDNNIHEGLMLDINEHIIEGTMSNLFMVRDNKLFTPEINQCGVAGIMRSVILDAATQNGLEVEQSCITRQELLTADELFVTNSVIGVWPIRKLAHQHFNIGPLTRHVLSWVEEFKKQDLRTW